MGPYSQGTLKISSLKWLSPIFKWCRRDFETTGWKLGRGKGQQVLIICYPLTTWVKMAYGERLKQQIKDIIGKAPGVNS